MSSQPKPPAAVPLTARQEARRARILEATTRLARDGGFEAVQMRAVAESSQVALGTLYRYFPSKIHLLVAALQDRLRGLHDALHRRPPAEEDPAARVAATLMRAFGALRGEPRLADAMLRALTFADGSAHAEVETVSRLTAAIILDAMGTPGTRPSAAGDGSRGAGEAADAGPELASAVRVVAHTWHSALIGWLSGRAPLEQVRTDVDTACRLITLAAPGPRPDAAAGTGTAGTEGAGAGVSRPERRGRG